jgi:hypothetical protein
VGDIVYTDNKWGTFGWMQRFARSNLTEVRRRYDAQKSNEVYQSLVKNTSIAIIGIYDDHDYVRALWLRSQG